MSLDVVATSEQLPDSLDGNGYLKVGFGPAASLTVNGSVTVGGGVAEQGWAAGINPVLVSGRCDATPRAIADKQAGALAITPAGALQTAPAATQCGLHAWPGGVMTSQAVSSQIDMAGFESIAFAMALTGVAPPCPVLTLEGWDGAAIDNVTGSPAWIGLVDAPACVVGTTVTIRGQASLLGCRHLRFANRSAASLTVKAGATFYARR